MRAEFVYRIIQKIMSENHRESGLGVILCWGCHQVLAVDVVFNRSNINFMKSWKGTAENGTSWHDHPRCSSNDSLCLILNVNHVLGGMVFAAWVWIWLNTPQLGWLTNMCGSLIMKYREISWNRPLHFDTMWHRYIPAFDDFCGKYQSVCAKVS